MPRTRNLKPAFFKNESLAEQDPHIRLFYQGLWTLADRNGLLELRPKRFRAEIFPYEPELDINGYITVLERLRNVIVMVDDENDTEVYYLYLTNFLKHQRPHHTEKTDLPCPSTLKVLDNGYITVMERLEHVKNPPLNLKPYTLNLNPQTLTPSEPLAENWQSVFSRPEVSMAFSTFQSLWGSELFDTNTCKQAFVEVKGWEKEEIINKKYELWSNHWKQNGFKMKASNFLRDCLESVPSGQEKPKKMPYADWLAAGCPPINGSGKNE